MAINLKYFLCALIFINSISISILKADNIPVRVFFFSDNFKPDTLKHTYYNSYKFKVTGLQIGKFSAAYERVIHEKYAFEIEPTFYYHNSLYDEGSQFMFPNIALRRQGVELKFSFGRIKKINKPNNRFKALSVGISYRYQHTANTRFWEGGFSGSDDYNSIYLSQTKNLIGLFGKASTFKLYKHVCLEHFIVLGFYSGYAKTTVFKIEGPDKDNPGIVNKLIYQPNGFTIIPVINFGISLRFNQF